MATVWLARVRGKHGFEKLYAVKTILPHLAADTSFRNMFLDEARIAARIRHTNVAEIEDLGEDEGTLYMVLEWLQGDAWSKLIGAIIERSDPIPADLMLHIAAQTCAGLHAAHELADDFGHSLNVVHRDVSPQNVMVTEAGVVKVIDFGVAKAVGRASEATRTGLIKGKLEYLAPELAFGKSVDRRADVWAVGATLYQTFAGRAPYTGKTDLDVLKRISSGKPPPPPHRPEAGRRRHHARAPAQPRQAGSERAGVPASAPVGHGVSDHSGRRRSSAEALPQASNPTTPYVDRGSSPRSDGTVCRTRRCPLARAGGSPSHPRNVSDAPSRSSTRALAVHRAPARARPDVRTRADHGCQPLPRRRRSTASAPSQDLGRGRDARDLGGLDHGRGAGARVAVTPVRIPSC
jgi:serine/threonine protein kinase